jgi:cell division transport system ATP-binding protein
MNQKSQSSDSVQLSSDPLISFVNVTKGYLSKEPVFKNINLKIDNGEFLFLTGISGAGKSTVFRLLMGLEKPDSGQVFFQGQEVAGLNKKNLSFHRRNIGMIFQDYKLLQNKTTLENIEVPLLIKGVPSKQRELLIGQISKTSQIRHLLHQKVESLSGGEQQLVAIARAAIHSPKVILADELTANLDQTMANLIIETLRNLNESGVTVIIATHDVNLIKTYRQRILLLKNADLIEVQQD